MEHTPTTTLERQLIARAAALRRPVSGSLELTPLCNMNCRMCYVRLSPRQARAAGALRTGQQWAERAHPMARAGLKKPLPRCAFCGRGGGREAERQRHPRKRRGDGPAVRHCPPIGRAHAHGRLHDARRCGRYGAYGTYSRYGQASLGEVGRRDKDGRIIRE